MAQVEVCFGPLEDNVNLHAREVHILCQTYHRLKSFWTYPMELLGDVGPVESRFYPFGDNVVLVQDNSTVCAKRTTCTKIILDPGDCTPR
jgi:hypothetical protein